MNRRQIKQIRRVNRNEKRINVKRMIRRYSGKPYQSRPNIYTPTRPFQQLSGVWRVWHRWDLHSVN